MIGAQVDGIRSGGGGARLTVGRAGGPAAAAGLRTGDVVVRIGSHLVEEPHDLIALVRKYAPGTTVTADLPPRRGDRRRASVTLAADAN